MTDQLLPDFDGPIQPVQPSPRKPRRKPMKKAVKRGPPPKPSKRVPKKRRARKVRVKIPPTFTVITPHPKPKMSVLDFVRQVVGVEMQPWQERILVALTQDDE